MKIEWEIAGKRERERTKVKMEMAMDLYTRSGLLKPAWSGEDARAAAWLGSALRDAEPPVS